MLVRDNSDFQIYWQFFRHLKMKLTQTELTILVIGTGEEAALIKAFKTAFPESSHTLCTRHLRRNSLQKLKDEAGDKTQRNTIDAMIFGDKGLIHSDGTVCYDAKCETLEASS